MTEPDPSAADLALAQMRHQSTLATWLARTIGNAAAIVLVPPVVLLLTGLLLGIPLAWCAGALCVTTVVGLAWLTSVQAPRPDAPDAPRRPGTSA